LCGLLGESETSSWQIDGEPLKVFVALVVTALLGTGASAQTAQPDVAFTTHGAFFALSVSDVAASTRWYTEKFGLRVTQQTAKSPGNVGVAILEGGGLIVELLQIDGAAAPGKAANMVHGFFKAGIIVDDLNGALAKLKARDVEIAYGPYPASATQRANAIVKDNAGNLIQLFGR
jgi:catechol 2,3-dioxygenase-like lactoylglutathione lyase family enzyme